MNLDIPIDINLSVKYIIVSHHRQQGYQGKSQWTISMKEEQDCFTQSLNKGWLLIAVGWGLVIENANRLKILGVNYLNEDLKIAKFINSANSNLWHGYPADLKRKVKDIPPINILKKWRQERIIKKHHISKIQRGVTCTL